MSYLIASPSMNDPFFGKSVICLCSYDINGAFGFILNKPIPITISELLQQLPEIKQWHTTKKHEQDLKETLDTQLSLQQPVRFGGPVQVETGFVMFELPSDTIIEPYIEDTDTTIPQNPDIKIQDQGQGQDTKSVSTSKTILYLRHLDASWKIHVSEEGDDKMSSLELHDNIKQTIYILPAKGNLGILLDHNISFKIFLGYSGWGEQQLTSEVERGSWLFAHQTDFTMEELFMVPIENQYDLALSSLGIQKEFLVMKPIED